MPKIIDKIKNMKWSDWILIILIITLSSVSIVGSSYYRNKEIIENKIRRALPEKNVTDDGNIVFVAKIKSICVAQYCELRYRSDQRFYIVDYDGHVFDLEFNPELLLLEEDQYIKLFYDINYYDKNVIEVDDYIMYGITENEYYGNIYPVVQMKTNDTVIGGN